MNNFFAKTISGLIVVLMFSSVAFAEMIVAGPDDYNFYEPEAGVYYERDGRYYRESTAPGYQLAWHTTDDWQRLGDSSRTNDGVEWSVDGGLTWGHDTMHVGTSVIFRYDFQRTDDGLHTYDQLKSWIDWNGDKDWDDEGEQLIALRWDQWNWEEPDSVRPEGFDNVRRNAGESVNLIQQYFYADVIVPDWAMVGETWMRTRVHCNHIRFDDTTAYGHLNQGEVEDYAVQIATPEPSTFILLGAGLLGLVCVGRRRKA